MVELKNVIENRKFSDKSCLQCSAADLQGEPAGHPRLWRTLGTVVHNKETKLWKENSVISESVLRGAEIELWTCGIYPTLKMSPCTWGRRKRKPQTRTGSQARASGDNRPGSSCVRAAATGPCSPRLTSPHPSSPQMPTTHPSLSQTWYQMSNRKYSGLPGKNRKCWNHRSYRMRFRPGMSSRRPPPSMESDTSSTTRPRSSSGGFWISVSRIKNNTDRNFKVALQLLHLRKIRKHCDPDKFAQ